MKKFYRELYDLLDEITPLQVDCGELCGKACCRTDNSQGVYLFPDEECMFAGKPDWPPVIEINGIKAINCHGTCTRAERPLFCRLFPLFPYIFENEAVSVIFYSPMKTLCPLIKLDDFELLAEDYLDEIDAVTTELISNMACYAFLKKISREIDAYEKEPWTGLL